MAWAVVVEGVAEVAVMAAVMAVERAKALVAPPHAISNRRRRVAAQYVVCHWLRARGTRLL